jgi:hypothetical protein
MADLEKGAQAIKDLLYVRINCIKKELGLWNKLLDSLGIDKPEELAEPPEPSPPDKP